METPFQPPPIQHTSFLVKAPVSRTKSAFWVGVQREAITAGGCTARDINSELYVSRKSAMGSSSMRRQESVILRRNSRASHGWSFRFTT